MHRSCTYSLLSLLFVSVLLHPSPVEAGIYDTDAEVTYKEYWVSHSEFTGGCGSDEVPAGGSWYLEPWPCSKTLTFEIPDDFSQALKVEIYLDLWRNHTAQSARFSLNGGPTHVPDVGHDWSRTPYPAEVSKSELQQGTNTITLWNAAGGYHVHDIGFRIYYDDGHPLLPGSGSDVTLPDGQLTSIVASNGALLPAAGGTLVLDDDQLTLDATASGGDVEFVEFHAYYYGYDEDSDGEFLDWHNLGRNNFHPGGMYPQPRGSTIDYIGTDAGAPYAATVMLQEVDTCRNTSYGVDGALWLARRLGMQAVCGPALEGLSGIARSGAPAQDSDSTIEWIHLSSANGDLPAPSSATQQTTALILDVDQDGRDDFVIGSRQAGPAMVWYQRNADGWTKYLIDGATLGIEAGGAFGDIDRDGDLDVVMGGDYLNNRVWWWENPYPNYTPDTPWTRREIKNSGSNKHHDQMFGDFDGDGQAELVFWNQHAGRLFIADIPSDPRNTQPWPTEEIFSWSSGDCEGLAQADINGDGKVDIVGGGRWFEHSGGTSYVSHVIDGSQAFARAAAGQLKAGGRPKVVFVPGDSVGRLKWYEWTSSGWEGRDLLGFDVDHGHSLEVADVDGDVDVLGTQGQGSESNPTFVWGHNDSSGTFTILSNVESDEYSQALVSVDGTLYGAGVNDSTDQFVGDGNGGSERTTGWQLFEANLGTLSAGEHVLTIGGYDNKKTYNDESTEVLIDDVVLAE